ncbi:hypothetical protein MYP_4116 [Sporocytophaga myxococcoides]|uniref:Uncharacterized protein n=1 Tax=Sporocytophaga myxococcoides TaxID=153721 RepID=A0A098LIS0_9BACT|nr:hypothetical protein MYP_4116 [Sporocytophaga myxococcoides]
MNFQRLPAYKAVFDILPALENKVIYTFIDHASLKNNMQCVKGECFLYSVC